MRKLVQNALLASLLLTASIAARAQSETYKAFKVDLTSGYSRPASAAAGNTSGGVNLSIEPKFNLTDNIAVGLKWEAAVLASGNIASQKVDLLNVMRVVQLTGEYYLGDKGVRPYGGIGLGVYKSLLLNVDDGLKQISESSNQFGIAPRIGLQFSHFRLGVEYNIVSDANYFSVKVGTTIGGGRK